MDNLQKQFVIFYSPGTFTAETTQMPVESWDVDNAVNLAKGVKERHGAIPYGFRFVTRSRGPDDLDSKETARSPLYYLGGRIETLADVEARNDPKENILRDNMRINKCDKIVINDNSWRWTQPLNPTDVVLDVNLRPVSP